MTDKDVQGCEEEDKICEYHTGYGLKCKIAPVMHQCNGYMWICHHRTIKNLENTIAKFNI